jgi:hypothetical protein
LKPTFAGFAVSCRMSCPSPSLEVSAGSRAVHQDHRLAVDLIQRPAGLDELAGA